MRIAIIGAGLAGLSCASRLTPNGHRVRLFDKGRGVGGRMATRRVETDIGMASFDHGAQYFTVRNPAFVQEIAQWGSAGTVASYPPAGGDAWVGAPGMNAPLKRLAAGLDVCFGARVETIDRGDGWRVRGAGLDEAGFDAVIVAAPAEQAAPLLADHVPNFAAQARSTESDPCWAVLASFAKPRPLPDILRDAGAIGWAARNSVKAGRSGPESWVIQGSPQWSTDHLEETADDVAAALLTALGKQAGQGIPTPIALQAHRWRYARSGALGRDYLWDDQCRIGVCGDWLLGPRVENAWLSGTRLAAVIGAA